MLVILVTCPVMSPASWVASTKRSKDGGSVHSSSMDATEDAAAGRVIAGQGAGERCLARHSILIRTEQEPREHRVAPPVRELLHGGAAPRIGADDVAGLRLRRGQRVLHGLRHLVRRDGVRGTRGGEPAELL